LTSDVISPKVEGYAALRFTGTEPMAWQKEIKDKKNTGLEL
jgi:hypothetical protein